jgi:hypothetical protein
MNIENIINSLSEEEKILHKDLIDECLQREQEFNKIGQITKESLRSFETFTYKLEQLFEALNTLNNELENYYNESIPDENYYKYLN